MHELGSVGENNQDIRPGDAFQKPLQGIFRGLVRPVEVLYGDDQGADLSALENNLSDRLDDSFFNPFGAGLHPVNARIPDPEQFQ